MLHTYLPLCAEFYDLDKPHWPKDASNFYLQYCKQAKGAILEPMCGTGRFLLPLVQNGFDVHGFDASKFMLDRLRHKASQMDIQPQVWEGYLQDLDHDEKYDLIFIPSGSFGLILDLDSVKASLNRIHSSLTDQG